MAQIQIGFVYNPSIKDENGNPRVLMVVVPDDDRELDSPSYNPEGCIQQRIPIEQYQDIPTAGTVYLQALIPGYVAPPPVETDE